MKFVSKNSNLRIVLRPGIPGNHLTGQVPQPGVYVKFQDGVVEIKDEDTINMMRLHPGYNLDFIEVEENISDPYASSRREIEPAHQISAINYGHVEKVASSQQKVRLPAEIEKAIKEQAVAMAQELVKQMLPSAVEETIKGLVEKHKDDKETGEKVETEKPAGKPKK
jgi:hypothetical protein